MARVFFLKLNQLGEFGLIDMLAQNLEWGTGVIKGIGDDTAVLEPDGHKQQLFTTDMLVEGVHFSLEYALPRQVGIKAMAVNVSDIAAMGGKPTHAVVSLALPPSLSVEAVLDFYEGLRQAAREYAVNVVGGDTVKNPERLVVNVALLGEVEKGRALYRSGAHPGDLVYVTGHLGASAAGLYICQHFNKPFPSEAADFARLAHLEPRARLSAGRLLAKVEGVTSMNDISDGLASEVNEICRASGVGCRIRCAQIPIDARVKELAALAGIGPLDWAFLGGEDFQLVFTVNPSCAAVVEHTLKTSGEDFTQIGEILPPEHGISLELGGGQKVPLQANGYNHFTRE